MPSSRSRIVLQPVKSLHEFTQSGSAHTLKLLSFNIQVGIETGAYHHYLTKSWQHLWPSGHRNLALKRIAQIIEPFDVVAIQEADGGSFRSGQVNQVEYLAKLAHFPHWYQQLNRNLGPLAQHSNGALSRICPTVITHHKLPGLLPGRGAIHLVFGEDESALHVVIIHLALGKNTQNRQLNYVCELLTDAKNVILMGDLNASAERLFQSSPLQNMKLQRISTELATFPSWKPKRGLDHIFVSKSVKIKQLAVLDVSVSDHLPIAMEIELPEGFPQA